MLSPRRPRMRRQPSSPGMCLNFIVQQLPLSPTLNSVKKAGAKTSSTQLKTVFVQ